MNNRGGYESSDVVVTAPHIPPFHRNEGAFGVSDPGLLEAFRLLSDLCDQRGEHFIATLEDPPDRSWVTTVSIRKFGKYVGKHRR